MIVHTTKSLLLFFIKIFIVVLLFSSFQTTFANLGPIGSTQTFIVSAYYSPLPNQEKYVWGSYEADKRVNGEGKRGSDFTKVYPGMLAAPSNYPYGTKIYIPGFGTGTVHDRGGRINTSGQGDRIDIWMGWGDDGRKRALQWGMRTVKGTIKPLGTPDSVQMKFLPASSQKNYTKNSQHKTNEKKKEILSLGSKGQSVTNLQNFLRKRGYLHVQSTGYFGKQTEEAVFKFQKDYKIVSGWKDMGAGVFGPKTRKQAEKIWNDPVIIHHSSEIKKTATTPKKEKNKIVSSHQKKNIPEKKEPYNPDYAIITPNLEKGDNNEAVKRLQLVLKGMGYFSGTANGKYEDSTYNAVLKYQKDKKIISSDGQMGAGRFGPQTYSTLVNELLQKRQRIKNPIASDVDFITQEQLAMRRKKINLALYNVQYGDKNNNVIKLQEELIARGFLSEGLNTGYFGNKTLEAMNAYKVFIG